MLEFSAKVNGKHAVVPARAEAAVAVEAACVGAAKIVDVGLTEMEAVAQGRPGNTHETLVHRIEPDSPISLVQRDPHIRLQIPFQGGVNVNGFVARTAGDPVCA